MFRLAFATLFLLTSYSTAAEFVVVNRCPSPRLTVVNRIPATAPARNLDPSHTCAKCGTLANVVKSEANGMHSHQCPSCGYEWWHADPGTAPAFALPSSGGCESGNCPAPGRTFRRGLFR